MPLSIPFVGERHAAIVTLLLLAPLLLGLGHGRLWSHLAVFSLVSQPISYYTELLATIGAFSLLILMKGLDVLPELFEVFCIEVTLRTSPDLGFSVDIFNMLVEIPSVA